jgi:thiol-disulfide isomerase/thioredoxin
MNRLGSQQPKGTSQQEQVQEFISLQTQRLQLARKAMGLNPPVEVKRQLVMAMYEILQRFIDFRVPSAMQQQLEFARAMAADPDAEVARIGRHAQFSANLARIVGQQDTVNGINGGEIVTEAKKLLDAEKGMLSEDTLQLVGQTADMLTEGGFKVDAAELIDTLAAALASDPKLADQAPRYALVSKVVKMDLDQLLNNVIREQPGSEEKIEAAVQTLLAEVKPSRDLLNRVQTIAHIMESTGHYKSALACYEQISTVFAATSEADLVEEAKRIAPAAKVRIGLVGQPLTVEGVMIDGTPLDWSGYAGKVVLVDFWATWCGPCLEEMPNIRANFEQFHSKGFEVVGVNMDTRASDIKQFLTLQGQDIPWVTVTSQIVLDDKLSGRDWSQLPMAAKCGVQAIPFVVLIGRDGKVDSIHVRGAKLKTRLTQLLGEPATGEIPSDPTNLGAPAAPSATRPSGGKQSRWLPAGGPAVGRAGAMSLLLAQALLAAAPAETPEDADATINPYQAKPGLTASELVAYIQRMLDRPQAIQARDGFTAGIVDACDRILSAAPPAKDAEQLLAVESKLAVLHRDACEGKSAADEQLAAFVEQLRDDQRPTVAREVAFLRLERRVLTAKEAPLSEIPAVLDAVKEFAGREKLTAQHLRMASSTVALINRLESLEDREQRFTELGDLFAKSTDKELSRYGRKIAKNTANK